LVVDVEERPESIQTATTLRLGERLRPTSATKFRKRSVDYTPAGGINLDRPPGAVAEV
jgi:hypothetical protein